MPFQQNVEQLTVLNKNQQHKDDSAKHIPHPRYQEGKTQLHQAVYLDPASDDGMQRGIIPFSFMPSQTETPQFIMGCRHPGNSLELVLRTTQVENVISLIWSWSWCAAVHTLHSRWSLGLACHTLPVLEMAQFSNVFVHGTINSAQGDLHINNRDSESGMAQYPIRPKEFDIDEQMLKDFIYWDWDLLLEQFMTLQNAAHQPNCHPGTRKAVRQIIADWIHYECWASSFFRLYGPAGAGKTTILQTIAEFLCRPSESDDNLGANFFLFQSRDQGHFLFSTIAYQLALKVPGLREHVDHIMDENPTFHTKSMDVQLQTLTVDAFHPSGFRDVPICDHRWIGWMLWQGGTTIHSPTPLRNNHSLQITTTI